jgi:proteasome lid subunit RPN8/RPN11
MAGAASRLEGDSSNFEEQPHVIECSPDVLEQVRLAVLRRFNRLPHGGSQTFGVLFGTREGRDVQITAFRLLVGENGLARSEALSEEDGAAFTSVLAAARSAGDLAGLEPVGWFRAHPRSELALSSRDREIFNSLFAEPWQVALILRPGNSAASRIRIFFRGADGSLDAEAGFREFMQAAVDNMLSQIEPPAIREMAAPEITKSPPRAMRKPLPRLARPEKPAAERRDSHRLRTFLWPAVLVACAMVALVLYWITRSQELTLRVRDSGGQFRITWDGGARRARRLRRAP